MYMYIMYIYIYSYVYIYIHMQFFPTSNECGLLSGFALHCDGLLLFGVPHFGPNLGKPTER